jgi:hypothetical protein
MNRFSKDLIESLTEACEHTEGKRNAVQIHVVQVPEISVDDDEAKGASHRRRGDRMG